jgi:hypothetical protein
MLKALAMLFLLAGIGWADEASDRKSIDGTIGALYLPQVRSDPQRMGELLTPDFDGDIDAIPVKRIWCETACAGFRLRSLKFVTPEVAVVDGETTGEITSPSIWLMVLKRDGPGWRLALFRSEPATGIRARS